MGPCWKILFMFSGRRLLVLGIFGPFKVIKHIDLVFIPLLVIQKHGSLNTPVSNFLIWDCYRNHPFELDVKFIAGLAIFHNLLPRLVALEIKGRNQLVKVLVSNFSVLEKRHISQKSSDFFNFTICPQHRLFL